MTTSKILAISGGVGGAKLALGLSRVLPPEELGVVANTGDDFEHLGMRIAPDLDTVMYTLAELSNKNQGWGLAGESWNFLEALARLGDETWFQLGDQDMATHIVRTHKLAEGETLSEVTRYLCRQLGIEHSLMPMTDDDVRTVVHTRNGETLAFQHYFVRERCAPEVTGFDFLNIDTAAPAPEFSAFLEDPALGAIVICPSNPFVSVDPVLKLPGVIGAMRRSQAPVIAVSPIVGGQAIKGPAAKMMAELGMPLSAEAVAEHYRGRIDGFVLDQQDASLKDSIDSMGIATISTNTVMVTLDDRIALANDILRFAKELSNRSL
ncbi:MAG: 2-phospho-L-lactate transferase [Pseudomonadales bacterium]